MYKKNQEKSFCLNVLSWAITGFTFMGGALMAFSNDGIAFFIGVALLLAGSVMLMVMSMSIS